MRRMRRRRIGGIIGVSDQGSKQVVDGKLECCYSVLSTCRHWNINRFFLSNITNMLSTHG
jgi:hypothetical protein